MKKAKRKPKYLKQEPKKGFGGWIAAAAVLVILVAAGLFGWHLVVNNILPEITVEVGGSVSAGEFKIRDLPLEVQLETDLSQVDFSVPGDYPVSLRYCGMTYSSVVQVRDTVAPKGTVQNLTVYATRMPSVEDFVTDISDSTQVQVSYLSEPDATRAGEQEVTIVLKDQGGNVTHLPATLTIIFDDTPPVISGVADRVMYVGQTIDLMSGVSVSDDIDPAPVLTLDDSNLDITKEGVYQVVYTAVNVCEKQSVATAVVTVIHDDQAPQMFGVRPLSVFAEGTISYRSNVIITDDKDEFPVLRIDSSKVNLMVPGTYPVVYTASDAAGNQTVMETTVLVAEKPKNFAQAEEIYAAADKVLAKIIKEDMTPEEQVWAIYRWVRGNCWYELDMDKTDWLQAAWRMLDYGGGDCFGYYAVARLMFERLGLPNLSIQRDPSSPRRTTHFWSMVSLDGGETFYHFDCCPHPQPPYHMCLVTDAILEWFTEECAGYYVYDKSLYPATPEE